MSLRLPDRSVVVRTNDEDPVAYYYHPLTAGFYRRRLEMAVRALGGKQYAHLLEVGYGSGIFLPALSGCAGRLSAFDIHDNVSPVFSMLQHEGISASLWVGDVTHIGVGDQTFDAVVCLSVLEHLAVEDLDQALSEIVRVSCAGARVVLGFPCRNLITDAFYRLVGFDPRSIHPSSHRDIRRAIERHLRIDETLDFVTVLPGLFNVYTIQCCTRAA